MLNAEIFRKKMSDGKPCLGCPITFSDPTVSEVLADLMDFVWIDMEHNPHTLETVQGHVMALKGSECAPLVRVPSNDRAIIKRVLDLGAAGVIVPDVRTADEVHYLVDSCLYPPEGKRGYGPRRASHYERTSPGEFCPRANRTVLAIAQIESAEAVNNIDAILAVPGLASICFGPNDMAGDMGHVGQGGHPDVVRAVETCIEKARKAGLFVGMGAGMNVDAARRWFAQGAQWMLLANDYGFMYESASRVCGAMREKI
jgi:2-keto-3-deoxy-L-rhamnonate aldolase RhmA